MADLLAHVLVAYAVLTVLGWRLDSLGDRWVAVGTGGAAVPDLVKIDLVLPDDTVGTTLGLPFDWSALGTVGGLLVVAALVALAFGAGLRRRAYAMVVAGGTLSLVLDGLRTYADGTAGPWLYPVWWRPPTPGLYVSSDLWVTGLAVALAGVVLGLDRVALPRWLGS